MVLEKQLSEGEFAKRFLALADAAGLEVTQRSNSLILAARLLVDAYGPGGPPPGVRKPEWLAVIDAGLLDRYGPDDKDRFKVSDITVSRAVAALRDMALLDRG